MYSLPPTPYSLLPYPLLPLIKPNILLVFLKRIGEDVRTVSPPQEEKIRRLGRLQNGRVKNYSTKAQRRCLMLNCWQSF